MATKNNPGRFDCYANATPDEPMFILLGRDRHAPALVRLWASRREAEGEDAGKVAEARACAEAMEQELAERGKKPVVLEAHTQAFAQGAEAMRVAAAESALGAAREYDEAFAEQRRRNASAEQLDRIAARSRAAMDVAERIRALPPPPAGKPGGE